MIAEKLQTIYKRSFTNGRNKDYYDLHILYRFKFNEINFLNLKKIYVKGLLIIEKQSLI